MTLRALSLTTALLAALASTGCGQKKMNECNSLIQVINTNVHDLEKNPKPEGENGPADLKAMADAMEKIVGDAAKVEVTIPELKKYSTDYQAVAKDVAKALRDMSVAAEAHDGPKMATAQQALEKAVKSEDPLVEGINKFCQAP